MKRRFYAVGNLQKWENLEFADWAVGVDFSKVSDFGYLPVFTTREQAEREYPDSEILEIVEAEK